MTTFEITYLLTVLEGEEIDKKIESACLEQSVELPRNVLEPAIEEKVVGRLISREPRGNGQFEVTIAWPVANLGGEISQFLNVLYGNISLQPGIRILNVDWSNLSPRIFYGPSLGISELRKRCSIPDRPLSATALKPVGKSPSDLADLCYRFACGGIDIIKDDHGLAKQEFSPFPDRVEACVSAIAKAADKRGTRSFYYPNITASPADTVEQYRQAGELGADGVLLCPHITGLETMHRLARLEVDLPIIAHPAFSGQLTTHETKGLAPDYLYGQLWRALGADFVIYPNKGGRFSFTGDECRAINGAARSERLPFRRSFPMPGGGLDVGEVDRWVAEYGTDTVFLVGRSLYEHPDGIKKASEEFHNALLEK